MLYIVFDGRANFDMDEASVLEYLGEMKPEEAYLRFIERWMDADAVLVEYDIEYGEAVHPVIIPREEFKRAPPK